MYGYSVVCTVYSGLTMDLSIFMGMTDLTFCVLSLQMLLEKRKMNY